MKKRLEALVTVGKYVGIDAMLAQIKPDEKHELLTYLKRYFLNTHGMSQKDEMRACEYQQEAAEMGYTLLKAIDSYCREQIGGCENGKMGKWCRSYKG